MIKNFTQLEHKIEEKVFHLNVPLEASLGEIWDILHKFQSIILEKMQSSIPQPIEELDGNTEHCPSESAESLSG